MCAGQAARARTRNPWTGMRARTRSHQVQMPPLLRTELARAPDSSALGRPRQKTCFAPSLSGRRHAERWPRSLSAAARASRAPTPERSSSHARTYVRRPRAYGYTKRVLVAARVGAQSVATQSSCTCVAWSFGRAFVFSISLFYYFYTIIIFKI